MTSARIPILQISSMTGSLASARERLPFPEQQASLLDERRPANNGRNNGE